VHGDSYLRPHKHSDPDKVEVFIVLQGKLAVVDLPMMMGIKPLSLELVSRRV
jgi:hypothetical protein